MTKIFDLSNPNGTLVKSAWLSETQIGAVLNVTTIYGSHMDGYRTARGARNAFGRNYQLGGKWNERKN